MKPIYVRDIPVKVRSHLNIAYGILQKEIPDEHKPLQESKAYVNEGNTHYEVDFSLKGVAGEVGVIYDLVENKLSFDPYHMDDYFGGLQDSGELDKIEGRMNTAIKMANRPGDFKLE